MTDNEQDWQRQHWQAIAEQLGLSSDSGTGAQSDREASSVQAKPNISSVEPGSSTPADRGQRFAPRGESLPPKELVQAASQEEGSLDAIEECYVSDEDEQPEESEIISGSNSASDSASDEASEDLIDEETAEAAEPAERESRSSRERKKQPRERTREGSPEERSRGAEEEEDEGEVEDFSNWSVPSWNELIASLYRPDR